MRRATGPYRAGTGAGADWDFCATFFRRTIRFGFATAAIAALITGCTYSGPITSTLMLNGDEPFLPKVGDFSTGRLADAPEGLKLRPGDVLFLSQQKFPPAGASVGAAYGIRSPSDLGKLRVPLRKIGVNVGPNCATVSKPTNALKPSERIVISTVLAHARQHYSYGPDERIEQDIPGLKWDHVRERFRGLMDRCGGRLWNKFVDSLRVHALTGSNERILVSLDLEALRKALPNAWPTPIASDRNPNDLSPRDVFGYLFIKKYKHGTATRLTRVEISTLTDDQAYSTFGHVLDASVDQKTYGDVMGRSIDDFKPRFTPRHSVVLNGVDFRSDDLGRDEMHWTLKEVEESGICVARKNDGKPLTRKIVSLRRERDGRALRLFDDRDGTRVPKQCDITVGLQPVPRGAATKRGRMYLGAAYFDYPTASTAKNHKSDFGDPKVCGKTWMWRLRTGLVAQASGLLANVPVHTISELNWDGPLDTVDRKPSVSDRCLVK